MEPGREFHPPATSVMVQAIYDEESIAFLVRWHDMRADKAGTAGPTLPVPIEEEAAGRRLPHQRRGRGRGRGSVCGDDDR